MALRSRPCLRPGVGQAPRQLPVRLAEFKFNVALARAGPGPRREPGRHSLPWRRAAPADRTGRRRRLRAGRGTPPPGRRRSQYLPVTRRHWHGHWHRASLSDDRTQLEAHCRHRDCGQCGWPARAAAAGGGPRRAFPPQSRSRPAGGHGCRHGTQVEPLTRNEAAALSLTSGFPSQLPTRSKVNEDPPSRRDS